MKFVKNTRYYSGVSVDRYTGKFNNESNQYRCYAASPERFPAVREHRWKNFEYVKNGNMPLLPKDCKAVRIHASGDFFNQAYFDLWIDVAIANPLVEFWAYTKSIGYWVNRLDRIPNNLELTASRGGRQDELIRKHNLKQVYVFGSLSEVPRGMPIDTNDDCARDKRIRTFALVDNYAKK